MRKMRDAQNAEDSGQTQRDQRIDAADGQPVDDLLDDLSHGRMRFSRV